MPMAVLVHWPMELSEKCKTFFTTCHNKTNKSYFWAILKANFWCDLDPFLNSIELPPCRLLAVVFQFAAQHDSQQAGSELATLAMGAINEIMYRNCVPADFENFLLQLFRNTFHLLQVSIRLHIALRVQIWRNFVFEIKFCWDNLICFYPAECGQRVIVSVAARMRKSYGWSPNTTDVSGRRVSNTIYNSSLCKYELIL